MSVNPITIEILKIRRGFIQAYRSASTYLDGGDLTFITLAGEFRTMRDGMQKAADGISALQSLGLTNTQIKDRYLDSIYTDDQNISNIGTTYMAAVTAHDAVVVQRRLVMNGAAAFIDDTESDLIDRVSTASSRTALTTAVTAFQTALEDLVK